MSDTYKAGYEAGWYAAFRAAHEEIQRLAAEGLVEAKSEILTSFRSGQETMLIVADHRLAARATTIHREAS